MDAELAIDLLTLAVASVGPLLAYRLSGRLAVSANRQAWLDSLRNDVAELISLADIIAVIHAQIDSLRDTSERQTAVHHLRDKAAELQILRFRIRLRLRTGNPMHDRLSKAVEELVTSTEADKQDRWSLRDEVTQAAEDVIQHVWKRIERVGWL